MLKLPRHGWSIRERKVVGREVERLCRVKVLGREVGVAWVLVLGWVGCSSSGG